MYVNGIPGTGRCRACGYGCGSGHGCGEAHGGARPRPATRPANRQTAPTSGYVRSDGSFAAVSALASWCASW